MATLRDVARKAGVSVSTVSHVINGYDDIGPETKRRVLKAIKDLDYHPNAMARNLLQRRSRTLGVMMPELTSLRHPFLSQIIVGLAASVQRVGYGIALAVYGPPGDAADNLKSWKEKRVEGLVIIGFSEDHPIIPLILESGIPTVFIDTQVSGPNTIWVASDNQSGAYQAVKHLIDLGHRRIAYIGGTPSGRIIQDRYEGYRRALRESGAQVDETLVVQCDFTKAGAYRVVDKLLATARPTAFFCVSDIIAIGALACARDHGLCVPDQVAVVGFDDIEAAEHVVPPLTTVRQDGYLMGQTAVRSLHKMISGSAGKTRQPVLLPVELIVRGSSGRAAVPVRRAE